MPEWKDLALAPALKRGLWGLGFTKPTEIQKRAVPFAMDGRDVVGVAETVSYQPHRHLQLSEDLSE
jgi:ATP-dependent RNA helicase DDX24/MAK5